MTAQEKLKKHMNELIAEVIEEDRNAVAPMERVAFYHRLKVIRAKYAGCLDLFERLGTL